MLLSQELWKGVLSATVCMLMLSVSVTRCSGQDTADEPEQLSQYELMIEYTKTNRDLADVELKRALEKNDNVIAIPRLTIERLRSNLSVAEEQFKQANLASTGGPAMVQLRHAEENVRIAQMELEAGRRLQSSGSISGLDLQRLQLRFDLAKIKVVMLKNPDHFVTLMDSMERRMDRLSEEILGLDQRLSQLESPGR